MKTSLSHIAIALILIFFTLVLGMLPNQTHHFTTEKGVDCVVFNLFSAPYCNWEQWNLKTNYGQYPVAVEPD